MWELNAGREQVMNCLHCGAPLQPGDTFCQECGAFQDNGRTLTDRTLRDGTPSDGIPTSPIPVGPVPLPPTAPARPTTPAQASGSAVPATYAQQDYRQRNYQEPGVSDARQRPSTSIPASSSGSPTSSKTVKSQIVIVVLIAAIIAVVLCIVGIVAYGSGHLGHEQSNTVTTSASANGGKSDTSSSDSGTKQSGKSKSKTKTDARDSTDTKKKSDSQSETKNSKDKKSTDTGTATYSNGRFAYAVNVPASYNRGPESDNGDGVKFSDPDSGVQIAVWGQNNALFHSPQDELDFLKENAGADPAFELVAGQSVYLSYEKDDTIYYIREIVTDAKIAAVEITYPNTDRAAGDPLTESMPPTLHFLQ